MMYKILPGTTDIDATGFFMFDPRRTSRSGGLRLALSVAKSQIRSKFFSLRTIGGRSNCAVTNGYRESYVLGQQLDP
ncbi:hypothetical protein Y032_0364g3559 [Ancylostoma ceylanicum]|uniref:Uncharacterized protein n=1 Tax=Ancylostoma ceylanicum TaxID=53326 RepID=A0A016RV68_9BILA|nr:hypothetical protein Y032_0364g3559 [Ancylostoma ceylanicum]